MWSSYLTDRLVLTERNSPCIYVYCELLLSFVMICIWPVCVRCLNCLKYCSWPEPGLLNFHLIFIGNLWLDEMEEVDRRSQPASCLVSLVVVNLFFCFFVLFTEKDPHHNLPHSRYHHFDCNFVNGFIRPWGGGASWHQHRHCTDCSCWLLPRIKSSFVSLCVIELYRTCICTEWNRLDPE